MGDGDGLHDGQPQPAAPAAGAVQPGGPPRVGAVPATVEAVEGAGRVLRGHARARVGHLQHHPAPHRCQPDRHRRLGRGVLAHVGQQVRQHLPDPWLVDHRDQPVRRVVFPNRRGMPKHLLGDVLVDLLRELGRCRQDSNRHLRLRFIS